MKQKPINNSFDRTVWSLCHEIDCLTAEVEYWKEMYESEAKRYNQLSKDTLASSKKGVADALMLALSVSEGDDGSLVISKDSRKKYAKYLKSTANETPKV